MVVRLCPLARASFDSLAKRIYTVSHEGEEWKVHKQEPGLYHVSEERV
jgi:hypothetical protein